MQKECLRKETIVFIDSVEKQSAMQVMDMRYALYSAIPSRLRSCVVFNSGEILKSNEFSVSADGVMFRFLCCDADSDIECLIEPDVLSGAHVTLVFDIDSIGLLRTHRLWNVVRQRFGKDIDVLLSFLKKENVDMNIVRRLWQSETLLLDVPRVFFIDGIINDARFVSKLSKHLPVVLRNNPVSLFPKIFVSMFLSSNAAVRYYGDVLYKVYYRFY